MLSGVANFLTMFTSGLAGAARFSTRLKARQVKRTANEDIDP